MFAEESKIESGEMWEAKELVCSEFTVDSVVPAAQGSDAAQYSFSQICGAPCGRSDAASERKRIGVGSSSGVRRQRERATAKAMLICEVRGGVFDGSLSIIEDGTFELRATPGDDHFHEKEGFR